MEILGVQVFEKTVVNVRSQDLSHARFPAEVLCGHAGHAGFAPLRKGGLTACG
jgi:hypothetical protein